MWSSVAVCIKLLYHPFAWFSRGMQTWQIGQEVECPICHRKGRVGLDKFKRGSREYYYITVRHYEGDTVRRCVVRAVSEEEFNAVRARWRVVKQVEGRTISAVEYPPVGSEEVQRVAWYCVKVASSWGSLRENPIPENLRLFAQTVKTACERLAGNAREWGERAVAHASEYMSERSEAAKARVNESLRNLVACLMEEVQKPQEEDRVREFLERFSRPEVVEALRRYYVAKKGFTPEQAKVAKEVMYGLLELLEERAG